MHQIWFTSDTHWGHARIIELSSRPFDSVEDMDEALIATWNSQVAPGDTVYHLGDVAMHRPENYLRRLNGQIHLVLGNHDARYKKVFAQHCVTVTQAKLLKKPQRVWLSHYAHRTWPESVYGSYHLYGHSHGALPGYGRSMDVGVDANNYQLVNLDTVVERLREMPTVNHHTPGL